MKKFVFCRENKVVKGAAIFNNHETVLLPVFFGDSASHSLGNDSSSIELSDMRGGSSDSVSPNQIDGSKDAIVRASDGQSQ